MLKSLFLGIVSSLLWQGIIIYADYCINGYWVLPNQSNFIETTILSGIAFSVSWYSTLEYQKMKKKN
jgi:membrane protein DedA with SNARE-associated domain